MMHLEDNKPTPPKRGVITSGLGHVYYICPDCGFWQQGIGAHQHKDGQWIQGSWLQEYYKQDKASCFRRWDQMK